MMKRYIVIDQQQAVFESRTIGEALAFQDGCGGSLRIAKLVRVSPELSPTSSDVSPVEDRNTLQNLRAIQKFLSGIL